ncbi:MAG TPA: flagellar basal body P-ring formation chaperone FlgA [Candidatus Limnocylindria bacterium]|nr:flagellar basal body P-ring formation chaperone FlgA [Candidatus Limnocylindria bacterium]
MPLPSSFRRLLLALLLALRLAADEAPLTLKTEAQVDSSGISLANVLDTAQALPAIRLTNAPAIGQKLLLSREQISATLLAVAPQFATTNWAGAEAIKVTRRMRPLEEAEALSLLAARLQQDVVRDRGELELRFSRPWSPVSIPDEPLSVRVNDLPVSGIGATMLLRLELRTARETVGTWQLVVQAKVWGEVWVAHSPVLRGQSLRDADLAQERRDLLQLHQPLASFVPNDDTLEISESLAPGQPLFARALRLRPVVYPGRTADALIQEGGMSITVKVEILEPGAPGQVVRVRNVKSKREFRGKVQNEQTILVSL